MVNCMLKIFLWNAWNFIRRIQRRKEKRQILCIAGKGDQIATSAKLLDIMHGSYGFSADLIEAITNEYQCSKAGFHWGKLQALLLCAKTCGSRVLLNAYALILLSLVTTLYCSSDTVNYCCRCLLLSRYLFNCADYSRIMYSVHICIV